MGEFFDQSFDYLLTLDLLGFSGLVFGLLTVYYLIKESVYTWPCGITYIIISFVTFWQQQLYGDFLLHVFFLILNIYGWYHWLNGKTEDKKELLIEWLSLRLNGLYVILTVTGIFVFGYFLSNINLLFENLIPASVPYWDAATTSLSVTAMWLTARKKIENWIYWFLVDVLAAGIYIYKEIYFYALLYFIYIGMAIAGYLAWKKIIQQQRI